MKISIARSAICLQILLLFIATTTARAQDGPLRIRTHEGWTAFEIATAGDQFDGWTMPLKFDGIGAQVHDHVDGRQLRVQVNHETDDATISEFNLDLKNFRRSVVKKIASGNTGGQPFINSVGQAYQQFSPDGGASFIATSDNSNTQFRKFCSGQSYVANTFGINRGFVDEIYITGEEIFFVDPPGRLMALDLNTKTLYQLSGTTGHAVGGIGGIPFDSWENAALLDTGETDHVALLMSADGGTATLKLYIGVKNVDANGQIDSTSFLARNGLAYGSHYFLNFNDPNIHDLDDLQLNQTPYIGVFGTTTDNALLSSKLEDVDTSISNPNTAVLGDENSGLFLLEFSFDNSSGDLAIDESSFSVTKLLNNQNDPVTLGNAVKAFGHADNLDWTAATQLANTTYPNGLIFVNEGNVDGEIWMMEPDGNGGVTAPVRIGDTIADSNNPDVVDAGETAGILDISELLGYYPGSILLNNNQGNNSSLSVLINPDATLSPAVQLGDIDKDGLLTFFDIPPFISLLSNDEYQIEADANQDGDVSFLDIAVWISFIAGM